MEIVAVLALLVILVGISNVSKQMAFDRSCKEAVRYSEARSVGQAKALGITPSRSALFWLGERRAYLKALQHWYKTPEGQDYLSFCSDMADYDHVDLLYEWQKHKERRRGSH